MLVRTDVLEVPEISAGVFGGSANGQALGKEVVEARSRIKSLLSNLHEGIEGLHNGLEGTVRVVKVPMRMPRATSSRSRQVWTC